MYPEVPAYLTCIPHGYPADLDLALLLPSEAPETASTPVAGAETPMDTAASPMGTPVGGRRALLRLARARAEETLGARTLRSLPREELPYAPALPSACTTPYALPLLPFVLLAQRHADLHVAGPARTVLGGS